MSDKNDPLSLARDYRDVGLHTLAGLASDAFSSGRSARLESWVECLRPLAAERDSELAQGLMRSFQIARHLISRKRATAETNAGTPFERPSHLTRPPES